tara:strand:+ start:94 stop:339 length:246 start_codon:yes stop_codon:yes gene_type:complete
MKSKKITNQNKYLSLKLIEYIIGHYKIYLLNSVFFKKKINYKIKKNLFIELLSTNNFFLNNNDFFTKIYKKYDYKRLGWID